MRSSHILLGGLMLMLTGCVSVTPTVEHDATLPFVELDGYKFHVRELGDRQLPPLIVVHGGPGGDSKYLYSIDALAKKNHVIFYDQRGTGLSPRVAQEVLTLESSLADLDALVSHYGGSEKVRLIGHSWGAMLVIAYLGQHPEKVSHAVVVEPGMLTQRTAIEFVSRLKASQSWWDALPMLGYLASTPFVSTQDGHERFDYVMTRMMNRAKPGAPYQCDGEAMPQDAFNRAGYGAFANMLKPVLNDPAKFQYDLTQGVSSYQGKLLMISSECSFIGYAYQQRFNMPLMPKQTQHVQAKAMGHNMLTLNPEWSVKTITEFFDKANSLN
ncbi:MAG: alpha/beta hydrolase [Sideroxydans sp.]